MSNTNRYEVTAPMPYFTHLLKWDILVPKYHPLCGDCWGREDEDNVQKWVDFCPDYPHLFRLLKWWERVPVNELPKYIKSETTDVVANVEYELCGDTMYAKNTRSEFWHNLADYADGTIPATEAEYTDYINQLNAK
jgi:hypothetical protein